MDRDQLVQEIIDNARKDRKRLEAVADGLLSASERFSTSTEEVEQINTEVAAAFAEEVSKVSDSLTRINHELVEIVKADRKSAKDAPLGQLPPDQVEDVLDEISPEEQPN